jgi:hypothetical protein
MDHVYLGFPTDAIYVVTYIYTKVCTKIRLPLGEHTESIQIERGTIQGDTLSPLLFLIYKPFYSGSM